MKTACLVLVMALVQTSAYARQSPEIEVVDGKISMSVTAMPLDRLLTLIDRAMGTKSEVKPELANRNISAQFTGLEFNDAIRKVFQGQPLNYMIISGKGIRVTDLAQAGPASTASNAPAPPSSFPEPQIFPNSNPIPPTLSLQAPQGIFNNNNPGGQQGGNPNQGFTMTPFGPQPVPSANQNGNPNGAPLSGPGTLPPALGMGNNNAINAAANGGGNVLGGVNNGIAFPTTTPQVPAPGTLGGATPGTLGR